MKKIMVAVMMVALLAAGGLVMAQGYEKGPGMGYGPHSGGRSGGHGLWRALNLTPEQVEKMKALRKSFFEQALPLRNDLRSKKLELKALWLQPNVDEEKILAKQKEINALRDQLQEKATRNRLGMRQILTPEQQAKLISLCGHQWHGYHKWHRHHRYGRGCGFGPGPGHHHEMGMGMGYGPRW
jgi:Spy/CpxP family protein refolding chaperone